MILILIFAPQSLAPGGTCPHLPSPIATPLHVNLYTNTHTDNLHVYENV